jgi:3-deoxy-D-manno-octulosonic-acid transferase
MIWLYRLLFLPALLLASPFYLRRMLRRGGYRSGFGQRFGAVPPLPAKRPGVPRIWLQAVSVGEILAIGPLLRRLVTGGRAEVYLTTTTSTGHALAQEKYGGLCLAVAYFPLDWWWFSRRAWRRIAPDLVLLAEGETWPEHLRRAARAGVPAVLLNARLSDRTFARLRRVPTLARRVFRQLELVLAGSPADERRFRELGVAPDRLRLTGNLKFDVEIQELDTWGRAMLRRELGFAEKLPVVLGSSTWAGEEAALLRLFFAAREAQLPFHLLLVPRHAERRSELAALLADQPVLVHFRSKGHAFGQVDVTVADTTGELQQLTQVADLVFVGKSLPPHAGGQTPIEAAALGRPLLFGPRMTNFRAAAESLVECGAAQVVPDADALVVAALALLRDVRRRETMAAAAARWHAASRGAVDRTVAEIERFLPRGR